MTVPTLMNCPHSDDAWCIDCVAGLAANHESALATALRERDEWKDSSQRASRCYDEAFAALGKAARERDEAYERAAKVADEYRAACQSDGSVIGAGTAGIIAATIRGLRNAP